LRSEETEAVTKIYRKRRPKNGWLDENDMKTAGVSVEYTGDRIKWKLKTGMADAK